MGTDRDKIDKLLKKIFNGDMVIYVDLRPFNLLEDCDMFLASKDNKDSLYEILWIAFNQLNKDTNSNINIDKNNPIGKNNYQYIDYRFKEFIDSCVDTCFSKKYNKNVEFLNMYHTPLYKDYENIDPLIQDLDY